MLKFVFLNDQFYYDSQQKVEILQNDRRPLFLGMRYEGSMVLVPLRSNISINTNKLRDNYPLPESSKPNAGLDYTKIIILEDNKYIKDIKFGSEHGIKMVQYRTLQRNLHTILGEIGTYLDTYCSLIERNVDTRSISAYRFSTLQYFHKELGLEKEKQQQREAAGR